MGRLKNLLKDFYNEFVFGCITESSLRRMVRSVPKREWGSIADTFWEFIPPGNYTDREKLEFVLCGVSESGHYIDEKPVDVVKQKIVHSRVPVSGKNCPFAKPNIVSRVTQIPGGEDALNELVSMNVYYVPERIKTEGWLRLMSLDHMILCTNPAYIPTYTDEGWVERIRKEIQHIKNVM